MNLPNEATTLWHTLLSVKNNSKFHSSLTHVTVVPILLFCLMRSFKVISNALFL